MSLTVSFDLSSLYQQLHACPQISQLFAQWAAVKVVTANVRPLLRLPLCGMDNTCAPLSAENCSSAPQIFGVLTVKLREGIRFACHLPVVPENNIAVQVVAAQRSPFIADKRCKKPRLVVAVCQFGVGLPRLAYSGGVVDRRVLLGE